MNFEKPGANQTPYEITGKGQEYSTNLADLYSIYGVGTREEQSTNIDADKLKVISGVETVEKANKKYIYVESDAHVHVFPVNLVATSQANSAINLLIKRYKNPQISDKGAPIETWDPHNMIEIDALTTNFRAYLDPTFSTSGTLIPDLADLGKEILFLRTYIKGGILPTEGGRKFVVDENFTEVLEIENKGASDIELFFIKTWSDN